MKILLNSVLLFKANGSKERVIWVDGFEGLFLTFVLGTKKIKINRYYNKEILRKMENKEVEIVPDDNIVFFE